MADIKDAINSVLNSKEGMETLNGLIESLGLSGNFNNENSSPNNGTMQQNFSQNQNQPQNQNQQQQQQSNQNFNSNFQGNQSPQNMQNNGDGNIAELLSGIMKSVGGGDNAENSSNSGNNLMQGIDINMIMKIKSLMGSFTEKNKNVDFLNSLRPHFSEKRQKKLDDAIKIMQLISVLPMLKELDIF